MKRTMILEQGLKDMIQEARREVFKMIRSKEAPADIAEVKKEKEELIKEKKKTFYKTRARETQELLSRSRQGLDVGMTSNDIHDLQAIQDLNSHDDTIVFSPKDFIFLENLWKEELQRKR